MINIEPGSISVVEEMHELLRSELEKPDSLAEITNCVDNYPSFVAFGERRDLTGLIYTQALGGDMLHIHGLHVRESSRNMKIGSLLLIKTEDKARKIGFRTITLTNSMQYRGADKHSAVPFYERHGYSVNHLTFNNPPTYFMLKEL